MITNIIKFIKNRKGVISIEFAGVFFVFVMILCVVYDIYNTVTLQDNLERTNYTVASLFRERSALYPKIDDTISDRSSTYEQFKSYELFTVDQVKEAQALAKKLLNKDVSIRIDALFIKQDQNQPLNIYNSNQLKTISFSSCTYSACNNDIKEYLKNRPNMAETSIGNKDYTKLAPFVKRVFRTKDQAADLQPLYGRYIPLYRVSMCINNDESLFLKFNNRQNKNNRLLPNLCSETTVISRCNDLSDAREGCPIYIYHPSYHQ